MELTQEQLDTLAQTIRNKRIKIELLNDELKVLDTIEGYAVDGKIQANANNSVRRSGTLSFCVPTLDNKAKTFLDSNSENILIFADGGYWIDKLLKIYVGIDNVNSESNNTVWNKMGVFLMDNPVRNFSANEYSISFNLADQTIKLNGQRQGQLTGLSTIISAGEYVDSETYIENSLYPQSSSNSNGAYKVKYSPSINGRKDIAFITYNRDVDIDTILSYPANIIYANDNSFDGSDFIAFSDGDKNLILYNVWDRTTKIYPFPFDILDRSLYMSIDNTGYIGIILSTTSGIYKSDFYVFDIKNEIFTSKIETPHPIGQIVSNNGKAYCRYPTGHQYFSIYDYTTKSFSVIENPFGDYDFDIKCCSNFKIFFSVSFTLVTPYRYYIGIYDILEETFSLHQMPVLENSIEVYDIKSMVYSIEERITIWTQKKSLIIFDLRTNTFSSIITSSLDSISGIAPSKYDWKKVYIFDYSNSLAEIVNIDDNILEGLFAFEGSNYYLSTKMRNNRFGSTSYEYILFSGSQNELLLYNEKTLTLVEKKTSFDAINKIKTDNAIYDIAYRPDGSQVALISNNNVYIYDSVKFPYTLLFSVTYNISDATCGLYSSDGSKFFVNDLVFNVGNSSYEFSNYLQSLSSLSIRDMKLSPDGKYLWVTKQTSDVEKTIISIDTSNYQEVDLLPKQFYDDIKNAGLFKPIRDFCFYQNQKMCIIFPWHPYIKIYDMTSIPYTEVYAFKGPLTESFEKCLYYNNGRYLALLSKRFSSDKNITLYDTSTTPYKKISSPILNIGFYSPGEEIFGEITANDFDIDSNNMIIAGLGLYDTARDGPIYIYGIQYIINNIESRFIRNNTKEVLETVIKELTNIKKYTIFDIPNEYKYLPYDIKVGTSSTAKDVIKNFEDILSTWQFYFDLDGIYRVEPIPSGKNNSTFPLNFDSYIKNQLSYNYGNVKNQIVVYGKLNNATYYTDNSESVNVIYGGETLKLYYSDINLSNVYSQSTKFAFLSLKEKNPDLRYIEIYSKNELVLDGEIRTFEGTQPYLPYGTIEPDSIYCIQILNAHLSSEGAVDTSKEITFELYSRQQPSACLVEDKKESPFYINRGLNEENYYAGMAFTDDYSNIGENYKLTLNNDTELTSLNNGTLITFMANYNNIYKELLSYTTITVVDSINGNVLADKLPLVENFFTKTIQGNVRKPIAENKLSNDYTIHLIKYDAENNQFIYLGRNPKTLPLVLSGGEYDNIHSDQLAYERCLWELYSHSNMQNTISIEVVPNYALDVNMRITYNEKMQYPLSVSDSQTFNDSYYLTKQITYPLGISNNGSQITALKIYDSGNLLPE